MSNYGATYSGGPSTTYSGAGTYKPSNSEALTSMLGQMAVEPYNPQPVTTVNNTASSVEGILGGLGQVAAAGVEIFGTDGALTPLAVIQGGQGILQIVQSIQALTGSGGGGLSVPTNTQVGCDVCAQLSAIDTAATNAANNSSDIGDQVWGYTFPLTRQTAGDDLALLASVLVKADVGGDPEVLFPQWAFEVWATSAVGWSSNASAFFNPSQILPDDTLFSFLTRTNSGWVVAEYDGPGGMCQLTSELSVTTLRCKVTPSQFEWLKWYMYTPSSGPPNRSLVGDLNKLFALIPIEY